MGEVTELLRRSSAGDARARSELYTLLYADLTRLARAQLAKAGAITLDPVALVHESWLRTSQTHADLPLARPQFFGFAASVMRNVVIDHVRRRDAEKRGGGLDAVTLSTSLPDGTIGKASVLRLDEALRELATVDERCHAVVEMRYFAGLNHAEIADSLGVSEPTIKRDWRRAKAFLFDFLSQP
jgi:RNA polymerase sigma factor (TIGR02999 family)